MWRNLAKVQSTIQTIGNVVAPALSDDDEEEDDEYSDEEADDFHNHFQQPQRQQEPLHHGTTSAFPPPASDGRGDSSDLHHELTENNHDDNHHHHSVRHRGFGLVGFLANALDGPASSEDDDDEQGEDDESPKRDASANHHEEEEQIQFAIEHLATADSGGRIAHLLSRAVDLSPRATTTGDERASAMGFKQDEADPPPTAEIDRHGRITPPVMVIDSLDLMSDHNPMRLRDTNQLPEPRPFGLVRERGSVSPFSSPNSIRSVSISQSGRHQMTAFGLSPTREDDEMDNNELGDHSGSDNFDDVVETSPRVAANGGGHASSSSLTVGTTTHIKPPPLDPIFVSEETVDDQPKSQVPASIVVQPTFSGNVLADSSSSRFQRPPTTAVSDTASSASATRQAVTMAPPMMLRKEQESSFIRNRQQVDNSFEQPTEVMRRHVPPAMPFLTSPSSSPSRATMGDKSTYQASTDAQDDEERRRLERRCKELEDKLLQAEARIQVLEHAASLSKVTAANDERNQLDKLREEFQEKEARLLAAAAEDHEQELRFLKSDMNVKIQSLQQEMAQERDVFEREREYFEQLVAEANARAEQAERQLQRERSKQEASTSQVQKQQERELQMRAEKLAESMALLDEREDQVSKLKAMVQTLQSKLSEHAEGAQMAEDEVDELHHENEELRHSVESLESICRELRQRNAELLADSNKLSELRLELRLIKEERDRERAKIQTETAAAHGNRAQVEEERDEAIAQVQDLQQQLAATLADLEIARADMQRIIMARSNLQVALESFQSEREAELAMLEEQRLESERALASAHAAAMDALRQANDTHVREIQLAADASVRHSLEEIQSLESKLESFRAENVQMRRSLDEAIYRLQATQEDVIDRTLMKNILMDWLTKTWTKERKDVLELMASVLHFSDDEKERVHIGPHSGTLEKVVHTVAAPLPPSKADVEHLAGDSVREKWVNFLLAETED